MSSCDRQKPGLSKNRTSKNIWDVKFHEHVYTKLNHMLSRVFLSSAFKEKIITHCRDIDVTSTTSCDIVWHAAW